MDPRKQMAKGIKETEIQFIVHDLRRIFITIAESLHFPAYASKRLLNHKMARVYIQKVKGYCCSSHCLYQKIADEEKMLLDHLYFALTLYGEARGENDKSKYAIAWIIQNRFIKKKGGNSYQAIVLRKSQFSCWKEKDPNHEKLRHPGKDGTPSDKNAWQKCKSIIEEVRNAPKNKNPIPEVYNYFSGEPKLKWQKKYFDLPGVPNFHFVKLK